MCQPHAQNIDGSRVERILEMVHIAANKNTVPGVCVFFMVMVVKLHME